MLCRGEWRFTVRGVHPASPDEGVDAVYNAMMHEEVPFVDENCTKTLDADAGLVPAAGILRLEV
jgi:hypothetical protein